MKIKTPTLDFNGLTKTTDGVTYLVMLTVRGKGRHATFRASVATVRIGGHTCGIGSGKKFATRVELDAYILEMTGRGFEKCNYRPIPLTEYSNTIEKIS